MSEITKLYENAGVETNKYKLCCTGCKHIVKLEVINGYPSKWICDKYDEVANCDKAEPDYSPFTAEKQIELIKWLAKKDYYTCDYCEIEPRKDGQEWLSYCHFKSWTSNTFENALAGLINEMWQDLTEEEKQQVKGILE